MGGSNDIALFRRRVGNTPLLRCKAIESRLGVGEIYLKLEGTNPTGHKSDRIAHRIVRSALQQRYDTITIGTVGYLANSIQSLSVTSGLDCVFFIPEHMSVPVARTEPMGNVRYEEVGSTLEEAIEASREAARAQGWYDANPGLDNTLFGMTAYSPIANELLRSFKEAPSSVSMSVGTGTLLSGVHLGFRQLWSMEEIDTMPRLFGGSAAGVNAIVEAFMGGHREVTSLDGDLDIGPTLNPLVNLNGIMGQPALEAIIDTSGSAFGLHLDEMEDLQTMAKDLENVEMTVDSAAALGAFARAIREGDMKAEGRHVVILSTGRTDLTIQEMTRDNIGDNLDLIIDVLDKWLEDFTDPRVEIREALENALDDGYVLAAVVEDAIVGLCILSRMELDTFFPRYHLSYIAADNRYEGRGVGTLLIQRAAELSGGDLSLHVERDNDKAIRLYKKMGFDIKYHRMHYIGGGEQ
jgi:threonine synthase